MKTALIIAGALLAVVVLLGAALLWFASWPFRTMQHMAGIRRPKTSKGVIAALVESTLALALSAFGLRRTRGRIGPSWHPCEECGQPIDAPSKAAFCSESCRRHQSLRRRAQILSDTDFA